MIFYSIVFLHQKTPEKCIYNPLNHMFQNNGFRVMADYEIG